MGPIWIRQAIFSIFKCAYLNYIRKVPSAWKHNIFVGPWAWDVDALGTASPTAVLKQRHGLVCLFMKLLSSERGCGLAEGMTPFARFSQRLSFTPSVTWARHVRATGNTYWALGLRAGLVVRAPLSTLSVGGLACHEPCGSSGR